MTLCFAPLLRWVLALWHGRRLTLALDATSLQNRFVVLCVSVLVGKSAIPVAWRVLPAQEKGSWRDEWLTLLDTLAPAVPKTMQTLVLADRGLYARWLYTKIVALGWHPFLRVNVGGTFRPQGETPFRKLGTLCPLGGDWAGRGTAFQQDRSLECTLLALWREDCRDPWLILTDLAPTEAHASWYRFRAWIEGGFKHLKSGGWQWQDTRMTCPRRVERVWLPMAIATLLTLSVGEDDPDAPLSPLGRFRRGRLRLLAWFFGGEKLVWGDLIPEEWDETPTSKRENTPPPEKQTPRAREYLPQ